MSRFQFVADHRDAFEVKQLCQTVGVSRSSFYAGEAAVPARAVRAAADAELAERIRTVHATDRAYGAPRVTAELNDGAPPGERVNHERVARVITAEVPGPPGRERAVAHGAVNATHWRAVVPPVR